MICSLVVRRTAHLQRRRTALFLADLEQTQFTSNINSRSMYIDRDNRHLMDPSTTLDAYYAQIQQGFVGCTRG